VVGGVAVVAVMAIQGWDSVPIVAGVGVAGMVASALAHGAAAHWTFHSLALRRR
jgi:hypothetical protein